MSTDSRKFEKGKSSWGDKCKYVHEDWIYHKQDKWIDHKEECRQFLKGRCKYG